MKWENPEIHKLSKLQDYGTLKVLLFALLNLWFFFILFGFINAENFRTSISFIDSPWFLTILEIIGNALAFIFLSIGLYSFYRYFCPPPPLHLTNTQRVLLGLPPLPEDSLQQNVIDDTKPSLPPSSTPNTPKTASSPSTTNQNVHSATVSTPLIASSSSTPYNTPISTFSSPASNSSYYSPFSSVSSTSNTPLGSPLNVVHETKLSPSIGIHQIFSPKKFPSPLKESIITKESEIERYLKTEEEKEALQRLLGGGPSLSKNMSVTTEDTTQSTTSIPLQVYRPSYRPPSLTPNKKLTDEELNYLTNNAARELYHRLGVDRYINTWTDKMRMWMATKILQPLVLWIEMVEHQTGVPLWEQQLTTTGQIFQVIPSSGVWTTTPIPINYAPGSVQEQLMKERMRLERYVNLAGCTSREYLVKRIKSLASGSYISAFVWNGGADWKNQKWTPELPTDTQILIHLFCTYMDELLSNDDSMRSQELFTRYHYVRYPANPDKVHSNVKIYQTQINPPHFNVIAEKEIWHILRGRNNLFQAIVMFLWYIKEKWHGFLHQTYLGTPSIGLLSIFDEDVNEQNE